MKNSYKILGKAIALLTLSIAGMPSAWAFGSYLSEFSGLYSSSTTDAANCAVCHNSVNSGSGFNAYGNALRNSSAANANSAFANWLAEVEGDDSDGEGNSNLVEIMASSQPGWCSGSSCANAPSGMSGMMLDPAPQQTNNPPVANAAGPYTGEAGTPIQFDGSGSSDPDGDTLVSYAWTFGDGSTGSGANPSHTYATGGEFTALVPEADFYADPFALGDAAVAAWSPQHLHSLAK